MNRSKTWWIAALVAGSALTAPAIGRLERADQASPKPASVTLPFDRFVLPNGLTVLVYTDHSVPTVHVGIRYRTGSRDEPAGRSGFAHLFEHLMFQPTAHRDGEFFTPLQRAGATGMNGSTDLDYTNYFETVPTNALDLALWMESDRMGYLDGGITQALLDEQRAVVKNEKRQNELQADAAVQAQFQANFYPYGHPYAHTTIGSMEDLDRASLDDVKGWFRDHYGASNAVLVLAGDIDPQVARQKVARYFGGIRAGAPVSRPLQWVPQFDAIRRDMIYGRFGSTTLTRTWPIDSDDPRSSTLMLLVARTLAGAHDTTLQRALVDRARVATGVEAHLAENALASSFSISLTLAAEVSPERAGAALDTALADYFTQGPDAERWRTVVDATDVAVLRTLESNAQVADFLLDGEINQGDPTHFLQQRRWIGSATTKEVAALAAKWLGRPYYEMRLLPLPATKAPALDIDRSRLPEPAAYDGKVVFPRTTTMQLANGMTLVTATRDRSPIVDVEMRFATGTMVDGKYAPGAAAGAFGLLRAGSDRHDAGQLAREASRLGGGLSAAVGDRQSSFNWSATTTRLDESFALAAEMLRRPLYPQAAIDAASLGRNDGYDNPMGATDPLFEQAVWGSEPKTGRPLRRADIVRFHDAEIGPSNATLYMIGDITPEEAKRLAERHFGDWRPITPTTPAQPVTARARARIILIDAPGAEQSSITVGGIAPPFDADRSAAESLVDTALGGGFESRLNRALRGKGWSYGFTGGISDRPVGSRLFSASGTVETDHTADSIAALRTEITDFVTTRPLSTDELESVRMAAIHAIPLTFTGNTAFLNSMTTAAAYGLPYDRAASATQRLAAVKLDEARRVAIQLYHPDTLTWLVVGDLCRIEPAIRALAIAPVEVWDARGRKLH